MGKCEFCSGFVLVNSSVHDPNHFAVNPHRICGLWENEFTVLNFKKILSLSLFNILLRNFWNSNSWKIMSDDSFTKAFCFLIEFLKIEWKDCWRFNFPHFKQEIQNYKEQRREGDNKLCKKNMKTKASVLPLRALPRLRTQATKYRTRGYQIMGSTHHYGELG